MKKIVFQKGGPSLFVIEFEGYDEHVHHSVDTIYAVTERKLTPLQVLREFARQKDIDLHTGLIEADNYSAEGSYNSHGYSLKVTKEPVCGNHSVIWLR